MNPLSRGLRRLCAAIVGSLAITAVAAGGVAPAAAQAGTAAGADTTRTTAIDSLRAAFRIPEPPEMEPLPSPRARPAASALSPLAFGAQWGDVFAGASYQARARWVDDDDGMAGGGFGLGDADRWAGLQVTFLSFSTLRAGWFSRAAVDLKVHRRLTDHLAVAAGWEGVYLRRADQGPSRYGVVTWLWRLRDSPSAFLSDLVLSVGAGDGRFVDEDPEAGGVGVFGSASVRVAEPLSVTVDWTGQDLAAALSLTPFRSLPLVATVGGVDLTGRMGDGPRLNAAVGLALDACPLLSC